MDKFELQRRTKKFHVDVMKLCENFPRHVTGFETAKQLIKAASSVGANYRAACRGKSKADFIGMKRLPNPKIPKSEIKNKMGLLIWGLRDLGILV